MYIKIKRGRPRIHPMNFNIKNLGRRRETCNRDREWLDSKIGGEQGNYAVLEDKGKDISRRKKKCSLPLSSGIDRWGQRLTLRFSKVISTHLIINLWFNYIVMGTKLCRISVLQNLFRLALWPCIWSLATNVLYMLGKTMCPEICGCSFLYVFIR